MRPYTIIYIIAHTFVIDQPGDELIYLFKVFISILASPESILNKLKLESIHLPADKLHFHFAAFLAIFESPEMLKARVRTVAYTLI